MDPETPADAVFCDANCTVPDPALQLAPLLISIEPPLASIRENPAERERSPPEALFPDPTTSMNAPP
jgi:hypothetical protein